ncbi:MAG: serine/threonine protein kinase, partial [Acidobacteriota bacterium]
NPTAMLADHIRTAPTAPSTRIDGEIPWDLENVILRCLEKDPNDRPESAEVLIQELSACRDSAGWRKEEASVWWNLHLGSPG